MIGKVKLAIAALALGLLAASPVQAGWKLIEQGKTVKVAKGALSVTPGERWNRFSLRPIKKSEAWTMDGLALNELYFVSGLAPGEPLFRDVDKKNNPLPVMGEKMLLTDIPEFYESSTRITLKTSLFEIEKIEPAEFLGRAGVKFAFNYSVQSSPVLRKGVAIAALVDGQLYLISYVAPEVHYFEHGLPEVEAIMASAKL